MPIPSDRTYAIPMLAVHDAAGALAFYEKAFGAVVLHKIEHEGKIGHCEIRIGDARVMVADEYSGHNASPRQLGGTAVFMFVFVDDVDAFCEHAVAEGAKLLRPISVQPASGDRIGKVRDPYGHVWLFASRPAQG